MKVIVVETQQEGANVAFELLQEKMRAGAKTLGLATGSSPVAFYQKLIASDLDFSEMVSLNLDEYVGLSADNPQSYHHFMSENLFNAKPFKISHLPNGQAHDLQAEAERYNQVIKDNPIDFQILGIGRNGHIGFNEPGTPFDSQTHLVDLASNTIEANARFFDSLDDVPKQALSMGIASILSAKTIVLFAYGSEKADALYGMVKGPITEDLPASALQNHADVVVIADKAAASRLAL